MAIGNKNGFENKKVYFVKVVTKDKDKKQLDNPYFSFSQKVGDEYKEVQQEKAFSGTLKRVETGSYKWEGDDVLTSKAIVEDGEEVYFIDIPFSILGRSVLNSLLSLENLEGLNFTIYLTKPSEKNGGKRFPQISIWQNDELVKWKYAIGEFPAVKKIKVGKKDAQDSSETDEFFVAKINERFAKTGNSSAASEPEGDTSQGSVDEDVPF